MSSSEIDVKTLAPMFGVKGGNEPDYLEYDIRGRSYLEKTFYNCGISFLAGMTAGGAYGSVEALRQSPGGSMRVKTNALMNGFGKRGSSTGNALGACAFMYTSFEQIYDTLKLDQSLGGHSFINPVAAGISTGMLYKSTAGPRALVLAGIIGGIASTAIHFSPVSLR